MTTTATPGPEDRFGAGSLNQSDEQAGLDDDLWERFARATNPKAFCEAWLSLQCRMLPGTRCALLLLGTPDTGPYTPAAVFPDPSYSVVHLAPAAERALKERRGLFIRNDGDSVRPGTCYIAYLIEASEKMHGVVVVEAEGLPDHEIQSLARDLHWGTAWLEVMLRRTEAATSREAHERLQKVLDVTGGAVEHEGFQPAAMSFVTRLATILGCDRVDIGFVQKKHMRVAAVSHSAEFAKRSNLLRAIESAMDEAVDQDAVIVFPMPADAAPLVVLAHGELSSRYHMEHLCTVPLTGNRKAFGALTVERRAGQPFDKPSVELLKTVAVLVGPILEGKRKEEKLLVLKAADACIAQLKNVVGPEHFTLKTVSVAILVVLLFFTFAKGMHRVRAHTALEGVVQRGISAPFNGYVMEAPARPGDRVRQGDLLCRLDDRELKLERLKWATQREQFSKQDSEALAKHDRAEALINEAKIDQAEAQVSLLDEQLSRTRVVAPFDGIVTSGDFSQSLGTPVERGQVLFEVAPLQGYRVIVEADERDMGWLAVGQRGELALPSVPGTVFPFVVTRITPVSTAKEGRNYFRVEAQLRKTSERLRPGMEGSGKISAGRARLAWIWSHSIIEWVRLKVWSWLP